MTLDIPTLLVMTVFVTALLGLLFIFSWTQDRHNTALAWWGAGNVVGTLAIALISVRGLVPDLLSIVLANSLLHVAYGLLWCGVRRFEGQTTPVRLILAGGVVWICACAVPAFYASMDARVILGSLIAGVYSTASALTLWRGRREALSSRGPAVVLMASHALCYFIRVPLAIAAPVPSGSGFMQSAWMSVLLSEALLHTVAMAFVFMALSKERAEYEQRVAARTDPLTGVANRRAFFEEGAQALRSGATATMLLFDLDHFKRINDTYGHAAGDRVLVAFADLAARELPDGSLLGRMGGEEFACLLPGLGAPEALRTAERIRILFRTATPAIAGHSVVASVSVGLAVRERPNDDLDALMVRADSALYRAKHNGRNRTEEQVREAA